MRLIDADALKAWIDCGRLRPPTEMCFSELDVVRMLDKQPAIDAEPVRHGRCMYTEGSCPADCPGYEMCITEGAEIMTEGAKAMDVMEGRVRMLAEGLAGTRRVYLYFATKAPIDAGKLPEDGYIAHVSHDERKYIRLIDDMAYGTVIYGRRLAPWEIAKLRLTSAPRE